MNEYGSSILFNPELISEWSELNQKKKTKKRLMRGEVLNHCISNVNTDNQYHEQHECDSKNSDQQIQSIYIIIST